MPRIPQTFARPEAVPGYAPARQIGDKMNIHSWDAMYEQGIRDAGNIADVGKQIGSGIQKFGAEIKAFVDNEKAKKDKIDYEEALNKYKIEHANYMDNQMQNLTNPETGAYEPERLGQDMATWKDTFLFETREQMGMSEEAYGMLQRGVNNMYANQEVSNIKTRANLRMQDTNKRYENLYNEAIANEDKVKALEALKLWSVNNPEVASNMEHYKGNIVNSIWQSQYIKVMKADPNNMNPTKLDLSEIPDTVGSDADKQKVKDRLVLEWKKERSYRKLEEQKWLGNTLNEAHQLLRNKKLSFEKITEWETTPGLDGQILSSKVANGLRDAVQSQYDQKEKEVMNKTKNKLYYGALALDYENDKNVLQKENAIISEAAATGNPAFLDKIITEIGQTKNRTTKISSQMSDVQKSDRTHLFKSLVAGFGENDEFRAWKDVTEEVPWWDSLTGFVGYKKYGKEDVSKEEQAISNIKKEFNQWVLGNPKWTMEEGQKKMRELMSPYAKENYRDEVIGVQVKKPLSKSLNITQEALESTAKIHGITVEEVKRKLGVK